MYKNICLLFALGFASVVSAQEKFKVKVPIKNIEVAQGGILSIGLFAKKENFPKKGKSKYVKKLKVTGTPMIFIFEDIPAGTYAVAVHHDANENNKMDKNFFGIPKEGYGFSKNVFHTFSAPSFEEAHFEVKNDTTLTPLKLKY